MFEVSFDVLKQSNQSKWSDLFCGQFHIQQDGRSVESPLPNLLGKTSLTQ